MRAAQQSLAAALAITLLGGAVTSCRKSPIHAEPTEADAGSLVLTLSATGELATLAGAPIAVAAPNDLRAKLDQAPPGDLTIEAPSAVAYKKIIGALDLLHMAGSVRPFVLAVTGEAARRTSVIRLMKAGTRGMPPPADAPSIAPVANVSATRPRTPAPRPSAHPAAPSPPPPPPAPVTEPKDAPTDRFVYKEELSTLEILADGSMTFDGVALRGAQALDAALAKHTSKDDWFLAISAPAQTPFGTIVDAVIAAQKSGALIGLSMTSGFSD